MRNGVTLYATVLGGPTRAQRERGTCRELLAWGVSRLTGVGAGDRLRAVTYATAPTGYDRGARAARRAEAERLRDRARRPGPLVERVVAPTSVALPVRRGQRLGEVRLFAGGKLIARSPLVAARAIDEPGFWEGELVRRPHLR